MTSSPVHVWTKTEITLEARNAYENPYRDVDVWVDLEGPGFARRVFGFWDGGNKFVVRVLATTPGTWTWTSGSSTDDSGLSGQRGSFEARGWTEDELAANPVRRGMVRASADGRGLEFADGTPYFLIGDTWWSLPTFRFALGQAAEPKPLGPNATLVDYVHLRKKQGFNCVGLIAVQPAWANDGHPPQLTMDDGTWIRAAWKQPGTTSAKDMHNEGGRPFKFPGKVPGFEDVFPDVDRINPEYFQVLDTKIDYLNAQGFVPFIEAARRDTGQAWQKFYDWPDSYARFIQYIVARYHANNTILSPIHYDFYDQTIPAIEYNAPIEKAFAEHGRPPFGTLLSANPNPSTLVNFGPDSWVDLHQVGNVREHYAYWYLTEIYEDTLKPALNGEPYYAGLHQLGTPYPLRVEEPDSEADREYVRSSLYGSFLSGGMAGFIYGAEGIWQSDIEWESLHKMWEAFQWRSADEVQHLKSFAFIRGLQHRKLEPKSELVMPNKSGPGYSYAGWAYCARTPDRSLFMLYFEPQCPAESTLRGASPAGRYRPSFFDPRTGEWQSPLEPISVGTNALLALPRRPDERDWGLMLERVEG